MPTSTTVTDLKINTLTKAQYNTSSQSLTELWMVTDDDTYVIQVDTLPTANSDYLNRIFQYVGVTDPYYTNGYFYKCVFDGSSYSWERIDVQPGGGGNTVSVIESYVILDPNNWYSDSNTNEILYNATNVTGVTPTNIVIERPSDWDSRQEYTNNQVMRISQGPNNGELLFKAASLPSNNIKLNILIINI